MFQKLKQQTKKLYLKSTGQVKHLNKGIEAPYQWYGNDYGGFYVCPDLLDKKAIVYSIGIGTDISFDEAILQKHDCQVIGFDPTPKSLDWLKERTLPTQFSYHPYGISKQTEKVDFYLPVNPDYVSGSAVTQQNVNVNRSVEVQMKSLKDIVKELRHEKIDVLKMDIEGSEYEVIESLFDADVTINQLLIEFHDRYFDDGLERTKRAIRFLKTKGYEIFAVSDSFEEVSFVRKKAFEK